MVETKTRDERIEELLAGSGTDAVSAIKGPSLATLTQPEAANDDASDVNEDEGSKDKKVRIRASRLNTLTTELDELRTKVSSMSASEQRIAALEAQLASSRNQDDELPEWWKEAYGDTDISKQGYKNQQRVMREEMKRALQEEEAKQEAAEQERTERKQSIEQSFDDQMDELEETLGRDLTSSQKSELLDIVGEYSPQEDGKYTAYMSVEKAYELWSKGQGRDAGKQEMARIAGSQSSGGTVQQSSPERPSWGDWRKRFGN